MSYEVKITDEAALKAAHPDLFTINQRQLKKRLLAARTLKQIVPGAELVEIKTPEKIADVAAPEEIEDIPAQFQRKVEAV